jgi:hypothetical protein
VNTRSIPSPRDTEGNASSASAKSAAVDASELLLYVDKLSRYFSTQAARLERAKAGLRASKKAPAKRLVNELLDFSIDAVSMFDELDEHKALYKAADQLWRLCEVARGKWVRLPDGRTLDALISEFEDALAVREAEKANRIADLSEKIKLIDWRSEPISADEEQLRADLLNAAEARELHEMGTGLAFASIGIRSAKGYRLILKMDAVDLASDAKASWERACDARHERMRRYNEEIQRESTKAVLAYAIGQASWLT